MFQCDGHNFVRLSRQDIPVLFPKEAVHTWDEPKYIENINSASPKNMYHKF